MATAPATAGKAVVKGTVEPKGKTLPELKELAYRPPAKGFTRYVCVHPTHTQMLQNRVNNVQVVEGNRTLETMFNPELKLRFLAHVCDVPKAENEMLLEQAATPHLDFGVKIFPATLLGQLLEDENNEIADKYGNSYGGRDKALNFIERMANHSVYVGMAKASETREKFVLNFITEWQRKISMWGYCSDGKILSNHKRIAEIAKTYGVPEDIAQKILEDALGK